MRVATRCLCALTLVLASLTAGSVPAHAAVGSAPIKSRILLRQGQTLRAGESVAVDGWRLKLRTDGELIVYKPNRDYLWMAGTRFTGAKRLVFQRDGNLVLYTATNQPVWWTSTNGIGLAKGVLRLSEGWNTAMGRCAQPRQPGALEISGVLAGGYSSYVWTSCYLSTLFKTSALSRGAVMWSPNFHYELTYQQDGDVILYGTQNVYILWQANTRHVPSKLFGFNRNLNGPAIYNGSLGKTVWSRSGTTVSLQQLPYRWFALQDDGNFVLYASSDSAHTKDIQAIWATNTAGLDG